MTTRWAELVALAEELDAACRTQSAPDMEKVRRLARGVIDLPSEPDAQAPRTAARPKGSG